MKKILYVREQLSDDGGAEISTNLLLDALREKYNISSHVFRTRIFNSLPMSISQICKTLFWYSKIKAIIKKEKPDVIVTQLGPTTPVVIAARRLKIPVLAFIRDFWFLIYDKHRYYELTNHEPSMFKKIINAAEMPFGHINKMLIFNALQSSKVVSNGEYLFNMLDKLSIKSSIVYPPLPEGFMASPDVKSKYMARTILFSGRIAETKGIKVIIEAMKNVDAKLIVLGKKTGGYYNSCMDLVRQLSLEKKITFAGTVDFDKIKEYYENASCVAVPSLWNEPFGRTAIEAMSTGTPVIASNRGALPCVCRNQIVVEPKPENFAREINKMLSNYSQYKKLCYDARLNSKKYLLGRQAKKLDDIIENAV